MQNTSLYIGLMSGTSLDGVDGVLVRLPETPGTPVELLASAYLPFSTEIRQQAMMLQSTAMMNCIRKPCWPTRWREPMLSAFIFCLSNILFRMSGQSVYMDKRYGTGPSWVIPVKRITPLYWPN
jgi:1,6-anhydro-N-acetylmuramate kinase